MFGAVSGNGREPVLPLTLLGYAGASDRRLQAEAVVDTGFDGELTLPPELVRRLGYPHLGTTGATLADGSEVQVDYFAGSVSWHGDPRAVVLLAADGKPLIGMELLAGSRLTVEVMPGGDVTVEGL